MNANGAPDGHDPVVRAIQTRHPGIADEIQGAIETLRKLQQLAGKTPPAGPAGLAGPDRPIDATTDGTSMLPPGAADATADGTSRLPLDAVAQTDPQLTCDLGPPARREVPVLAGGESFGRYQVVRLLGHGAMGAVYLAYDPELQRHVALKTPFVGDNPEIIQRFYREARSAAQVRSPYVCPVYDVGRVGDIYYISMAFIDGQPLGRLIADGRLKDARAVVEIARKIARGLHKAHELGIIHRDLKPDNIMIDADGEPIVMDFGLARRADEEVQLTAAGKLFGTPAYMSPEQVDADPTKIGPATDIYSLGVVLYQMLTGRLPFQGSLTSILRQIGSAEPPRPSAIVAEIGEGSRLEGVCLKMMAKSPAGRYASTADVVVALDDVFPRAGTEVVRRSAFLRLRSWLAGFLPSAGKSTPGE
jgi:serine/threonine protein kinase